MNTIDFLKKLIAKSGMKQKEVACGLGMTEQTLCNKFRRGSISSKEFVDIIEYLGYEVKVVEKNTEEEVETRKAGVGERLKMMVNNVKYDTFKASALCHTDETQETFDELYVDDEGRYFVAHYVKWEGGVSSISPISELAAKMMIERLK